jgi:anaerobic magnesium-protoporphyrin IX monomethyl ester cyclase
VRELGPDDIGISVSYPLPGTGFHERVAARLGDKRNWAESDDLDPLFPGVFSQDFYQRLSRTVHAEFRARRALRTLRGVALAPRTATRGTVRALGALVELPIWLRGSARLKREADRTQQKIAGKP